MAATGAIAECVTMLPLLYRRACAACPLRLRLQDMPASSTTPFQYNRPYGELMSALSFMPVSSADVALFRRLASMEPRGALPVRLLNDRHEVVVRRMDCCCGEHLA